MVITEATAKTKWCPHMFPHSEQGDGTASGCNCMEDCDDIIHIDNNLCMASKCMMWVECDKGFGHCGLAKQ